MAPMSQVKFFLAVLLSIASGAVGAESITLASTTSTEQSGLFAHLLPLFKQASGLDVKLVAVSTGKALDLARHGDADAFLVNDQAAEEKFVAEGFGLRRHAVMYTNFMLIGPKTNPAATRGADIVAAPALPIAASNVPFVSHVDESGTHSAEIRYRSSAGPASQRGGGDRECGCGMGRAEHGHRLRSLRTSQ